MQVVKAIKNTPSNTTPQPSDETLGAVIDYMNKAKWILASRTTYEHKDIPGEQLNVGYAFDGEYVWPVSSARLMEKKIFIPPEDFVNHVLATQEPPQEFDKETITKALDFIQDYFKANSMEKESAKNN